MKISDLNKYFFLLSLGMLMFGWGFAAERYKIFPARQILQAKMAFDALRQSNDPSETEPDKYSVRKSSEPLKAPRARQLRGDSDPAERILVAGGAEVLSELHADGGCLAWVMDRTGQVRHFWRNDLAQQDSLCVDAKVSLSPVRTPHRMFPMGMHLSETGDLLVALHALEAFPYGVALVKYDADSQVVWTLPRNNHHWFSVDSEGRIHVPYQTVRKTPVALGDSGNFIETRSGQTYDEGIMVVDPQGKVLEQFSVLDALIESGYISLFAGPRQDRKATDNRRERFIETADAVHLNDVQLVTESVVNWLPGLAVGDYLVSLRESNSVAILDGKSHRVKWISTGSTVAQHSPRFHAGGILVFDNLGGPAKQGGSRLALLDLRGQSTRTVFPRPDVEIPETFFSYQEGHVDLHPDNRRALVASTYQGVVWEVDLQSGEVLWEYIVPHSADLPLNRRRIHLAKYCGKLNFPMNHQASE